MIVQWLIEGEIELECWHQARILKSNGKGEVTSGLLASSFQSLTRALPLIGHHYVILGSLLVPHVTFSLILYHFLSLL